MEKTLTEHIDNAVEVFAQTIRQGAMNGDRVICTPVCSYCGLLTVLREPEELRDLALNHFKQCAPVESWMHSVACRDSDYDGVDEAAGRLAKAVARLEDARDSIDEARQQIDEITGELSSLGVTVSAIR